MTEASIRVAFWNTWLLAPRLWRRGPRVPGLPGWFAPEVERRAPLVARAVEGRFDVVALSEVFEASEQHAVADAWPEATLVPGPGARRPRVQGSGLATLVGPAVELVRAERLEYRSGGDLRDSDTFATKGALLTTVRYDPDLPPLDLVSTHLLAGGDLFPIPGANDRRRHHVARMEQVDELVGFLERVHEPSHLLVVVGDFNVQASTSDYDDLAQHLDRAGLRDVWGDHGVGPGPTCTFTSSAQLPPDPDEPDQVVDREGDPAGERIDYLWLATPRPSAAGTSASVTVDVDRPRRWAFSGRGVEGGPAGSLSDHLALSTTLHVRA